MAITAKDVLELIAKTDVGNFNGEPILDKPLREQGFDSLDMANVFLAVDEEFGVNIPDEEIVHMNTINDMVAYVNKYKA